MKIGSILLMAFFVVVLSSCSSCCKEKGKIQISVETLAQVEELKPIVDMQPVEDVNEDRIPRKNAVAKEPVKHEPKAVPLKFYFHGGRPAGIPCCNV